MGFVYLDILIFAAIAAFLFFRLRDVLGTKHGSERKRSNPFEAKKADEQTAEPQDKVATLDPKNKDEAVISLFDSNKNPLIDDADKQTQLALTQIALGDRDFTVESFVDGAKTAFEYIVENFAAGNKTSLEPLLSHELMDTFEGVIDARAEKNQTAVTEILNVKDAVIEKAFTRDDKAYITVKFIADECHYIKDEKGEVIEGDPEQVHEIEDIWTFERLIRNVDPNWILVKTDARQ